MSYVVQIWYPPAQQALPTNMDSVLRAVAELSEAAPTPNFYFIALVDRLTQRYPCLDDIPVPPGQHEPPIDKLAWSDGCISGDSDSPIFNLGLASAMLGEVQPFVVSTANALGLCVLDEQAGKAYLPDGIIIGIEGLETVPDEPVPPALQRSDLKPAELANGVPYALHIFRATFTTISSVEQELKRAFARSAAESHAFRRAWFDVVAAMLNKDQRDAKPFPWFDGGPLEPQLSGEVWTIQVRPDCIAALRDRVVRAAAWQGLSVYDPQSEQAFWPSNDFVVNSGYFPPYGEGSMGYPESRAIAVLGETLTPLMAMHDFTLADSSGYLSFERHRNGVLHTLIVFVSSGHPGCAIECRLDIEMTPECIEGRNVVWPVDDKALPLRLRFSRYMSNFFAADETFAWFLNYDPKRNYCNQNSIYVYEDIHAHTAAKAIALKFAEHALPLFDRCATIEGANELLNSPPPSPELQWGKGFLDKHWSLCHILLAHLADDPRFDAMCKTIRERYAHHWAECSDLEKANHGLPPAKFESLLAARRQSKK